MRSLALALLASFVALPALADNRPPPDATTGKRGDTVGQTFDPQTGKWVDIGSRSSSSSSSSSDSGSGELHGWRSQHIWNSVELSWLRLSSPGPASASERGGAIAYDVFTTPERPWDFDRVARAHLGGGLAGDHDRLFDLVLALGAGVEFGPVSVMLLGALDYDAIWGKTTPTFHEALGLGVGPELHVQLSLGDVLLIDVLADRFYKLTGSLPNGGDLPAETRVGAALSLISSSNLGGALGVQVIDYGIGKALMATAAVRWGAH
jgi:hypothetical protein